MSREILTARQLTKRYGERLAVDSVSFAIQPGESVGLLGPNGAGKTTTFSMITGLIRPDSGQVMVRGRPMNSDTDPIKGRLGLVPQDLALYEDLDAPRNLEFFAAIQEGREPNASVAQVLPCYKVLHELELQLNA